MGGGLLPWAGLGETGVVIGFEIVKTGMVACSGLGVRATMEGGSWESGALV